MVSLGKATKDTEAGILPKSEAFAALQKYNEELVQAGVLLAAEGLAATSKGARVTFSGDKRTVMDSPYIFPNGEEKVEIRKAMELEDCGDGFTPNPAMAKVTIK